jgi:hypothetical protein
MNKSQLDSASQAVTDLSDDNVYREAKSPLGSIKESLDRFRNATKDRVDTKEAVTMSTLEKVQNPVIFGQSQSPPFQQDYDPTTL